MAIEVQTAPANPENEIDSPIADIAWSLGLFEPNEEGFDVLEEDTSEAKPIRDEGRALIELVAEEQEVFELVVAFGVAPGNWITYAEYASPVDPIQEAKAVYRMLLDRIELGKRRQTDNGLPAIDDDDFGAQCKSVVERIAARLASQPTK
jgi:hypothetical protein